jgi:hypothetical protein
MNISIDTSKELNRILLLSVYCVVMIFHYVYETQRLSSLVTDFVQTGTK